VNTASLSLDQAPPIAVPLRFFLTAPLFGLLAGLLLLIVGPELLSSRWAPNTLAATHLLTLGFLGLVMCGAILQMLPVVAGTPVPAVVPVSIGVHLLVSLGTLLLCSAFLGGPSWLFVLAGISLGLGLLLFIGAVAIALARVGQATATTTGMRLALTALTITLGLGLVLLAGFSGWLDMGAALIITDIHLGWGLLGWVGLLVIGVAYQVVPMFQLTPEYPSWMTRFLLPSLLIGLLVWTLLLVMGSNGSIDPAWKGRWEMLLALAYGLFAATTLWLQQRRKRRLADGTVLFWRTGMTALLVGLCFHLIAGIGAELSPEWLPKLRHSPEYPLFLGLLLVLGITVSVISGMLYKIVPFLCWFHLQHRKIMGHPETRVIKVPNMKQMIADRPIRRQLIAHLLSLALMAAAVWVPSWFARPAGIALMVSMLLLWLNLIQAARRYRQVSRALDEAKA